MRYTYLCENEHEQEEHHSMHDDPDVACIVCGQAMWRVPQVPRGIVLHGSFEILHNYMDKQFRNYKTRKEYQKKQERKKKSKQIGVTR